MKKKWSVLTLILLLNIPFVLADITTTLDNVFKKIMGIGNLNFLGISDGGLVIGFIRILIWILIFTIFFAVTTGVGGKGSLSFLKKNHAIVISLVIATITAVFLPANVLTATGVGWATAIALILIGGPIMGLIFLLWKIPFDEDKIETRGTLFIKLILCLLLFWILNAMKFHLNVIKVVT